MKKTITYFTLSLLLCLSLIFTGCDNQNKTLARNLDDTVTNLVYSVSSLDWADSSMLANFNSNPNTANNFSYNVTPTTETYENLDDIILDTNTPDINDNENDLNNNSNNDITTDETLPENTDNNLEPPPNNERRFPPRHHRQERGRFNNRPPRRMPSDLQNNEARNLENNDNNTLENSTNTNMSGFNPRRNISKDSVSRINNNTNLRNTTRNSNNLNLRTINNTNSRTATSSQNNNPVMMVTYSTSTIENSISEVQQKLSELINQRTNLLLYINDLYKGYVELSEESIKAVNAYINIIKDNTSYLNNNRGMVSNQISQANEIATTNSSSPLINAYIIRTNETIETRLAKLDSSISAIDSICNIMQASLTTSSPNFNNNITNNINNNSTNNTTSSLSKNITTELNQQNSKNNNTTTTNTINNQVNKNAKSTLNNRNTTSNLQNNDLNINKNNILETKTIDDCPDCIVPQTQEKQLLETEINNNYVDCPTAYKTKQYSVNTASSNNEECKICLPNGECVDCPPTTTANQECIDCPTTIQTKEIKNDIANLSNCTDCIVTTPQLKTNNQEVAKDAKTDSFQIKETKTLTKLPDGNNLVKEDKVNNDVTNSTSTTTSSTKGFIDKNHNKKSNITKTSNTRNINNTSEKPAGYVINNNETVKIMPYTNSKTQSYNTSNVNLISNR